MDSTQALFRNNQKALDNGRFVTESIWAHVKFGSSLKWEHRLLKLVGETLSVYKQEGDEPVLSIYLRSAKLQYCTRGFWKNQVFITNKKGMKWRIKFRGRENISLWFDSLQYCESRSFNSHYLLTEDVNKSKGRYVLCETSKSREPRIAKFVDKTFPTGTFEDRLDPYSRYYYLDIFRVRERERYIACSLDNCWIVNATDVFSKPKNHIIVYERMAGKTLRDVLSSRKCLPESQARFVIFRLLHALSYIHSKGIIHRAVRPSSIFFAKSSKWDTAKNESESDDEFYRREIALGDFGSACFTPPNGQVDEQIGSLPYISVDLMDGSTYDCKSDVWSVGIVLYEMLTGIVPFKSKDPDQIRLLGRLERYQGFQESFYDLSLKCQSFIRRLLEVNPEDRLTIDGALNHPWMQKMMLIDSAPVESYDPKISKTDERALRTKCQAEFWTKMNGATADRPPPRRRVRLVSVAYAVIAIRRLKELADLSMYMWVMNTNSLNEQTSAVSQEWYNV